MPRIRRSASVNYGCYRDDFHNISSPDPAKLRRVLSLSRIEGSKELPFVSYTYRDTPYSNRYLQPYDVYHGQWYDRRLYNSPAYWPYPAWKFRYLDAPESLFWNYPTLQWYPRTSRQAYFDQLNPSYWGRRQTDPYYSRPLYYPYRPWAYESMDIARAMRLHSMNLIGRNTLEKYWLTPSSWERRWLNYTPPYRHASWYTSPRRYSHSYIY